MKNTPIYDIIKSIVIIYMKLTENTSKAILTGAIAGMSSALLFGENGTSSIGGMSIPTPAVIAAAGFAGSYVGDTFSDNVIKMLPKQSTQASNAEKFAVKMALSGGACAAAMKIGLNIPNDNLIKAAALGAGSKAGADYITNQVVNTKTNGFILGLDK